MRRFLLEEMQLLHDTSKQTKENDRSDCSDELKTASDAMADINDHIEREYTFILGMAVVIFVLFFVISKMYNRYRIR